jgi:hypothetical protein
MPQRKETDRHGVLSDFAELFTHLTTHTGPAPMDACPKKAFRLRQRWLNSSGLEREAFFIQLVSEINGLRRNGRFEEFSILLKAANDKAGIITTERPRKGE